MGMVKNYGSRGAMAGSAVTISATPTFTTVTTTGNINVGGSLRLADGSAAAPSLAFTNATTTGLALSGGQILNSVGGANKMSVGGSAISPQVRMAVDADIICRASVGLTASTTQTQGQGAIATNVWMAEVATCANANDVVTLPVPVAGKPLLVINNGAQTLQVFPSSGTDLGDGANTSTTIASGSRKEFWGISATVWEPVI